MKKIIMLVMFVMVFGLVSCDEATTTSTLQTDSADPCSVDPNSDACIALYEERTVFEFTDMKVSRDMIYDLDEDDNGWVYKAEENGSAEYSAADGGVLLSGSQNLDVRTSYMFNRIQVPSEITYGLVVKYQGSSNESEVRIKFVDRFFNEVILQNWTEITSDDLQVVEFDLSAYKGQTLVVYIEHKSVVAEENSVLVKDIRFGISGDISTKTFWTFDEGLEDWKVENNGKQYDHSEWKDGYIYLDGSDFGLPEEPAERNGWTYNMFQIPEDATSVLFSFDIWANPDVSDANFRIRVFDENLNEYVLNTTGDWETFDSEIAFRYIVDLTQFAGQRIALFLESDDDGEGCGEAIYLDNFNLDIEY